MLRYLLSLYLCIFLHFKTWLKEELYHQGKWHPEDYLVLQKTYLSHPLLHSFGKAAGERQHSVPLKLGKNIKFKVS